MVDVTTVKGIFQIGVGIDTARYGHHVSFLKEDRQRVIAPDERFRIGFLTSLPQASCRKHIDLRIETAHSGQVRKPWVLGADQKPPQDEF